MYDFAKPSLQASCGNIVLVLPCVDLLFFIYFVFILNFILLTLGPCWICQLATASLVISLCLWYLFTNALLYELMFSSHWLQCLLRLFLVVFFWGRCWERRVSFPPCAPSHLPLSPRSQASTQLAVLPNKNSNLILACHL